MQARGGCACAGPYAQSLMGISPELAAEFEDILKEDDRLDRTHLRRGQSGTDGNTSFHNLICYVKIDILVFNKDQIMIFEIL